METEIGEHLIRDACVKVDVAHACIAMTGCLRVGCRRIGDRRPLRQGMTFFACNLQWN